MIRIQQIKVPLKHDKKDIEVKIRKLLRLDKEQQLSFQICRQSIDARRKKELSYVYTVDVEIDSENPKFDEEKIVRLLHSKDIMIADRIRYRFPSAGSTQLAQRPVIAGSGPAGLFCAYLLALYGYQPVIIERGKMVKERKLDVEKFWKDAKLDLSSNVQFGEGGAGTFSDGKLNTFVKDKEGRNRFVLETLVECGADSSILYVNKPHIGTDRLIQIVKNLREAIISMGGTFYFETALCDIEVKDNALCSITVESNGQKRKIETGLLVAAVGHSARDTFAMFQKNHVPMEAKAFAVGLRIEHPQEMINAHQYKGADMRYLPAASYQVSASDKGPRGVYSFCMCPGGYVVNASTEHKRLTVNGMSYHDRNSSNANSAIVIAVTPKDFPGQGGDVLGGIAFQRKLEECAYALGGGRIPQQLYGDFKQGRISSGYGDFSSKAKGACTFADLGTLLPEPLKEAFIDGMERFAGYIPQFNRYDAILSAVESRTSSPVRILRDKQRQSMIEGIYPCGEGAGYAGGIMSAAMDGMKTAEAIRKRFKPL